MLSYTFLHAHGSPALVLTLYAVYKSWCCSSRARATVLGQERRFLLGPKPHNLRVIEK